MLPAGNQHVARRPPSSLLIEGNRKGRAHTSIHQLRQSEQLLSPLDICSTLAASSSPVERSVADSRTDEPPSDIEPNCCRSEASSAMRGWVGAREGPASALTMLISST